MKHRRRFTAKNQKGPNQRGPNQRGPNQKGPNQRGGNHSVKHHAKPKPKTPPRCNLLDTRLRHKSNNVWKNLHTPTRQGEHHLLYHAHKRGDKKHQHLPNTRVRVRFERQRRSIQNTDRGSIYFVFSAFTQTLVRNHDNGEHISSRKYAILPRE